MTETMASMASSRLCSLGASASVSSPATICRLGRGSRGGCRGGRRRRAEGIASTHTHAHPHEQQQVACGATNGGGYTVLFEEVVVKTQVGIALYDITDHVNRVLAKSGVKVSETQ